MSASSNGAGRSNTIALTPFCRWKASPVGWNFAPIPCLPRQHGDGRHERQAREHRETSFGGPRQQEGARDDIGHTPDGRLPRLKDFGGRSVAFRADRHQIEKF
jgi:hypothetical protein